MGSIQLLLGKSRWRRRRALPHEHLSGVDGLGRPTFLYVTDTQRKRAVVEREFLDWRREAPVFAPRVRVLAELFDELHLRHGRGSAILPDRVAALVAERVLADHGERWPWLAALGSGPEVGRALAHLHRLLAEARRSRVGDVPHAAELDAALAEVGRCTGAIAGFVTRPVALEGLLQLLAAPPPALVQWLRATHSVVLDDILQLSALRREVLIALCRAWESAGAHVVVAFETGRGLGGREAEAFFEYGDVDDVALPLKPFAATRDLRRALFEAVVARGDGGRILLAGADDVVEIEPWTVPELPEPPDLADWIYGSTPVPVADAAEAKALCRGRVRLVRCDDPAEELREIARQVKLALLDGADPGACVVALPDLSTYGPGLRSVFADHGIPCTLAAGARLSHSPVTNAVRRVATVGLQGWPVDVLLALVRSDLVRCPDGVDPAWLRQACRGAGVRDGLPLSWEPALRAWLYRTRPRVDMADLAALRLQLERLQGLCARLAPLSADATPTEYRDRLLAALDALDLPARVARCDDPAVAADNLHAWGAILRQVDELVSDLTIVDPGSWPARALADDLDSALHGASYHPEAAGGARVQVVGALELRGLTPHRVWLGGLHRTAFPPPPGDPFLVPRDVHAALDPYDPLAEARYLFGSLLRNALDDGRIAQLVISWPATLDGQPLGPSPVLADLLDRPTAGGALLGDLVVESPAATAPLSRSDALRAGARTPEWLDVLSAADAFLARLQRAVYQARRNGAPGEFEGVLSRRFPVAQPVPVTRLEAYLQCPARFGYRYVLGLDAPRDWEPELDAMRRGAVVHTILDRFLERRGYEPLVGADRDEAAALLHRVAAGVLDWVESQGGAEQALIAQQRRRWLAGLVDGAPAGLLRAWLDAEVDAEIDARPVATEREVGPFSIGPVAVSGKVDRIDRLAGGGLVVSDYKTGTPPSATLIARGLMLQPVAYSAALTEFFPGEAIAAAYYQVKSPEKLGRQGWSGDGRVLDAVGAKGRGTLRLDDERRQALLDHAGDGARRMLDGVFHTTLADPEDVKCEFCEFRRICRYRADRASDLRAGDADLQRPLEAP